MKKQIYLISFLVMPYLIQAQNYFAGTSAGLGNTGTNNTAVGGNALSSSNSGINNSAFGASSLRLNTTGTRNTAAGSFSLFANTTGSHNTASGYVSLYSNTTGSYNSASGSSSLQLNTTGSYNTASGYASLYSNSTGYSNTASGYASLYFNTTGTNNTASGDSSLYSNTTGIRNTASGHSSLYSNTTGTYNTASGYASLWGNKTGSYNTAIGEYSLFGNITGSYNTAIGDYSLYLNGGSGNVAVGAHTGGVGFALSNSQCTFLGTNSAVVGGLTGDISLTNATAIGYGAKVDMDNKVVIGNTSVTSIGGQVGWTTYSDSKLKTNINKSKLGLNFILQLNPVTYNYKAEGQKDILYTGLLAQEVDAAAQKTGAVFSGVDKNGEYWGVRYAELTVPLITSVQELNEKAIAAEKENQQLKNQIEKLQSALENLKTAVEKLQQNNKNTTGETKASASLLFQNQPNPFNQATTVAYQLQPADKNAAIVVRNMNGSIVKQINIPLTGSGKININAGELAAGTYTYSLLTGSGIADTKLMVITK
jgi:trimeric autotransporter adhesin